MMSSVQLAVRLTLAMMLFLPKAGEQTQTADQKPADQKPAESKAGPETYQTIYLTNVGQQNDANDLVTDLRNMLPKARTYYLPSQGAISILATADELKLAQKILSDLDRARTIYRLTYSISETESGKSTGKQHYSLIAVSGGKANFKLGNRVPIVTGTVEAAGAGHNSQVQYVDVGLNIEASLEGYLDGLRLRTKVEESSLAEDKSSLGGQDPVFHQAVLEDTSPLAQGKPLVLGSLDIPGSSRRLEIEVVSELVQ